MAQAVTSLPYTFTCTVQKGALVALQAEQPAHSLPCGTFKVPGCAVTFKIWARISASGDELFACLECVDAAEGFEHLPGMTQVKATVSMSVEATQGATTVMAPREMYDPKHEQVFDSVRRYSDKFTCKASAADGTPLGDDATFKLAVTVTSLSHDLIDIEHATARLQLNSNAGNMVPSMYGKAEYSDVVIVVPAALRAVAAAHSEQEPEQEEEPELRMPCHRVVLATVSEPLDKMLSSTGHFKEGSQREVTLQEVRPSVAKAFLQWCYGLPVEVTLAQAVRLWLFAEQYMVSALSDSCCQALLEAVSSNDGPGALLQQLHQLAQELAPDCAPAQALWKQLLAESSNVSTVLPTTYAASLPVDKVKAAVSAANASHSCGRAELAVAVLRWAFLGSTDESSFEAHLPELLRCVTLADVPVGLLKWLADQCSAAATFQPVRDRAVAAEVLGDIVGVLAECCTRLQKENAEHQQAAKRRRHVVSC